jgi:AraC-like DNA-binding protein
MPGSSTSSFTDPEGYQAELSDILAAFVVLVPGAFAARTTRTRLHHLELLSATESLPRVGYAALRPDRAFISFSPGPAATLVWRGLTLEPDEIVLHGRAERLHQRILGPSEWGLMSLSPEALARLGETETGSPLAVPERSTILRPSPLDLKRLLRMLREAARLAATRPYILGHPEVVRAMGEELSGALAACLTRSEPRPETGTQRCATEIMVRFEALIAAYPDRSFRVAELCDRLGVTQRRFHNICVRHLGATALQYVRLRQRGQAKAALRSPEDQPEGATPPARHAGFTDTAGSPNIAVRN